MGVHSMQQNEKFTVKAAFVTDDQAHAVTIMPAVSSVIDIELFVWESLQSHDLLDVDILIFDVDIGDVENINRLKAIQKTIGHEAHTIYPVNRGDRRAESQINALGAKYHVGRPLESGELIQKITDICTNETDLIAIIAANTPAKKAAATSLMISDLFDGLSNSILRGEKLPTVELNRASRDVIRTLDSADMDTWLAAVRTHSSFTYKHVMVVTGLAAAFGLVFNMSHEDKERLTLGALVHDIGKTKTPLKILDKPGKLSDAELRTMRRHPVEGYEILTKNPDLGDEVTMIARSHHEYMDGSGYPDGLHGNEIPDIVRVMTVIDIFSALIEARSYKRSLQPMDAYILLQEMGGKLDQDVVRAFEPIALNRNTHDLVTRLNQSVA